MIVIYEHFFKIKFNLKIIIQYINNYIYMPIENYKHYLLLTPDELITMIENKDNEINLLKKNIKEINKSRDKYCSYNQFHMEEISRLDKIIGKYKRSD